MADYRIPTVNDRAPDLTDCGYYAEILGDPNINIPTYLGLHLVKGASQSDLNWKIYKFFYTGTGNTEIQLAYGAWSSRTSLF